MPFLARYAHLVLWAVEQHRFPMPEQVIERFGCSRATAHRWLNALEQAFGVERPRRDRNGVVRKDADR